MENTSAIQSQSLGTIARGLGVFTVNTTVYLYYQSRLDTKNVTRIADSTDGIDFQFSTKVTDYQIKKPEYKFKSLLDGEVEIEAEIETPNGYLVLSHVKKTDFEVSATFFDNFKEPKIIWQADVWQTPEEFRDKNTYFIGLVFFQNQLMSYWGVDDLIYLVIYPNFKIRDHTQIKLHQVQLEKHDHNPLISPNSKNSWEAFNTFNPAAIYEAGKVHILYRAQGFDYVSVVGYASSTDGVHIDERLEEPAYLPSETFEYTGKSKPKKISHIYVSGGGFGGVEDPRVTKIDGKLYMTYVAFDGVSPPRVVLTSISIEDFLAHHWFWEKPVLISPPNVVDKSACIFPEKINGKYVIMHRIYPNILIDFVDSLSFDGSTWLKGEYAITPRPDMWDSRKIGAGAPPIKTKDGWLLIYQSVDNRDDGKYKIGAMILDLNDPTKVLHRSRLPILEPMEHYENHGFKPGVVYPCGAVVINDTLFVYYGGADSYVCVATSNLEDFLKKLQFTENPKLEPATIQQII